MTEAALTLPVTAADGHRWELIARVPASPRAAVLWLPALGVAARHYDAFTTALAAHDIAMFVHEWRGNGSSSLRASREHDWGYRELLQLDLPASVAAIRASIGDIPLVGGGHSLGGQLACCYAGLAPTLFSQLWLVASGTPYWRAFPAPLRLALPLFYGFMPWLARRRGTLPGRQLGFGGNEARGLIDDWAQVGRSGRYAARGLPLDLEAALANVATTATAVVLADDWFAPLGSTQALLAKLRAARHDLASLDRAGLGNRADHFAWMKTPARVAELLQASLR